jgi:NADH-quinone oxidoreductase subunit B
MAEPSTIQGPGAPGAPAGGEGGFHAHLEQLGGGNLVLTSMDEIFNLARVNSLWYMLFGLACCAIEMMATGASNYDFDRFGMIFRASPRQSDLMIVAGTCTLKMAPRVKLLYQQMPEPKYVIAMGGCATNGGPFYYDNYSVLKGIDKVIPVDVYLPGCPPRPEALMYSIMKLQEKIKKQRNFQARYGSKK